MLSDLRLAFRFLAKSPGFTTIAVLTLGLGIGLNTALFRMINGFFLQPLAYPHADQLVRVYRTTPQTRAASHSVPNYLDLAREAAGTIQLASFRLWTFTLAEPGRPPRMLNALRVSAEYFPLLGQPPEQGRFFTADEDRPGAPRVVMLSHDLWQTEFGGDPAVIGRDIRIDGEPTTVVGVMPASFTSLPVWGPADIWCPVRFTDKEKSDRPNARVEIVGRRAAHVTPAQAEARLKAIAAQLARDHPAENAEQSVRLHPLQSSGIVGVIDTFRRLSWFTLGLAASVLLITCANLANLQLGRALRRSREYAVCAALGASRLRLMRPILCECLLIALAGGAAALLISMWAADWLTARFNQVPGLELPLDWRVLVFAFATSIGTGLLFGLAPAWLISRLRPNEILKTGARGAAGSRLQSRLRDTLIVGQFALAMLLLAGAGFFERGTARLLTRELGWSPAGILQGTLSLPNSRYPDADRLYDFYRRLQQRLSALPGVHSVAVSWTTPIFYYLQTRSFIVDGRTPPPTGHEPVAYVNAITPSFVETLRLKLVSGRPFAETDDARAPNVILVNETMARALFPGESALGRRIRSVDTANTPWLEIVGVVRDVQFAANFAAPATRFQVYRPLAQDTWSYVTVSLRATTAPGSLARPFRDTVASLDSDLPVQGLVTTPEAIETIVSNFSHGARVLGGLALLGLLLAALGIYGVISNLVVQRTSEIGIRLALGAPVQRILWLVLGTGVRLALIGVAVGLLGATAIAGVLRSIAPELSAQGPAVALAVTFILLAVALLACWLPARRATHVNPLDALRAE